jgi:elongation factor 3
LNLTLVQLPLNYLSHLSYFKVKPEAQSYYQLAAAALRFKFPEPAPLDGVTSREKSILKMVKVMWLRWLR